MKKYKHKQTGNIATLVGSSGYKLDRSTLGLIPKEYIENTCDWEEIKLVPLFTTEDGKDIYEGDYFTHTSGWDPPKTVIATLAKHFRFSLPMDKTFSTRELAEEYVMLNQPCFSISDVISALDLNYNLTMSRSLVINKLKAFNKLNYFKK